MSIAYKISAFNRRRKWKIFNEIIKTTPQTTILDIGFSSEEYSETDNFLEKNYDFPSKITALGIDDPQKFLDRYPLTKAIQYDGKKFPFSDYCFTVGWSNAVIEHVGDRDSQLLFIKEINRTCNQAFITTPNRYFPIEVHTRLFLLHYLPKPIFDMILKLLNKKWATDGYMNLLSLNEIKELMHLAGIKDYQIIKNRLFGFTLDFIITWQSK